MCHWIKYHRPLQVKIQQPPIISEKHIPILFCCNHQLCSATEGSIKHKYVHQAFLYLRSLISEILIDNINSNLIFRLNFRKVAVREYIPQLRHAYSGLRGFSTCSTKKKPTYFKMTPTRFRIFFVRAGPFETTYASIFF